ncbi:hydroxyisourate hydrolase [Cohnella silvisoli]|uniref:5-hydroxyisourate hydrolase n=1 Tax=Cohnella silvisoli TaxID=2873699 RepID=A0ABV1KV52_9BACL|nr:hydroxyisourate hydrolase [Cohnella silvisoli]MCD9023326.1 hydroxyisourate hydrolase [Cohnella silvisoli]
MGGPGRITTHVLSISEGKPAMGMKVQLWKRETDATPILLKEDRINADGRLDEPLLAGGLLTVGIYELVFNAGEYFKEHGLTPLLFDFIPIRFEVSDAQSHYHVPLLVAPGGYSTYRGS